MYCKNCGKEINDDSIFCKYCGVTVVENDVLTDEIEQLEDNSYELKCDNIQGNKNNNASINVKSNKKYFIFLILIISVLTVVIFLLMQKKPAEKIAGMSDSVFLLNIYDENDELIASGSGFLAFDDLTVITNYHVIQDAYRIEAISENNVYYEVIKLIGYDSDKDLAILELDSHTDLPVLKIDSSYKTQKGDTVIAIGSPLGIKNTVSDGIISTFVQENDIEYIQFTAPVSSGSSGGPLFNTKGEVIGVTTASFIDGQNINLAIPIKNVTNLKETGQQVSISIEELNISNYGTKPINTGNNHSISKYMGYYYHNYNDKYEIIKVDAKNGNIIPLGIFGENINVYNKKIYYIFKNELHISDLQGENINTISVDFKNIGITNTILENLFVNKYGIFLTFYFLEDDKYGSYLIEYDFNGRYKGLIACNQLVQHFSDDSFITTKNKKEVAFNGLNDLKEYYSISMEDYSNLFIFSSYEIYNDYIIYQAGDYDDFIYKLDLDTGKNELLYSKSDKEKFISIQAVYKDFIYFQLADTNSLPYLNESTTLTGDTYSMDINGKNLTKVSPVIMDNINFIEDKIYFLNEQNFIKKYYSCDLEGKNLIELK